jgi:hypothetical protein
MNKLDKTYKKAVDLTEKIKILLQRKIDDCESRLYEYRKELKEVEREREEIDLLYKKSDDRDKKLE